jgi:hypothetical protein
MPAPVSNKGINWQTALILIIGVEQDQQDQQDQQPKQASNRIEKQDSWWDGVGWSIAANALGRE